MTPEEQVYLLDLLAVETESRGWKTKKDYYNQASDPGSGLRRGKPSVYIHVVNDRQTPYNIYVEDGNFVLVGGEPYFFRKAIGDPTGLDQILDQIRRNISHLARYDISWAIA